MEKYEKDEKRSARMCSCNRHVTKWQKYKKSNRISIPSTATLQGQKGLRSPYLHNRLQQVAIL
jgi:hypothetical protein